MINNFSNKKLEDTKGFTLIELLAVLIIVSILAAISAPVYMKYVEYARAAEVQTAMAAIKTGLMVYNQNNGRFTRDIDELKNSGDVTIDDAIASKWTFEILASDNEFEGIQATSTDKMPGGAGKQVRFQANTGDFVGYGSKNKKEE